MKEGNDFYILLIGTILVPWHRQLLKESELHEAIKFKYMNQQISEIASQFALALNIKYKKLSHVTGKRINRLKQGDPKLSAHKYTHTCT